MKVTWHGHACVSLLLDDGTRIIIDPFINGNPMSDLIASDVQADYILITHAHNDHIGDTELIARNNGAQIISTVEIADYFNKKGFDTHGMQPGGAFNTGRFWIKQTPAIHGSSYTEADGNIVQLGLATGVIVKADGKCIYHAGDTALFSDMRLIGEAGRLDYAFLPIGDNYTMGPRDACKASSFLQPRHLVPIHYNTFELIEQDPETMRPFLPKGVLVLLDVGVEITI